MNKNIKVVFYQNYHKKKYLEIKIKILFNREKMLNYLVITNLYSSYCKSYNNKV